MGILPRLACCWQFHPENQIEDSIALQELLEVEFGILDTVIIGSSEQSQKEDQFLLKMSP